MAKTAFQLFPLDEMEAGSARRVEVGGHRVAVTRVGDELYAIGDRCSHADVSLSQGWVDPEECTIECVQHGAVFDLATGEALTLPATRPVPVYDIAVVDGMVTLTVEADGREAEA